MARALIALLFAGLVLVAIDDHQQRRRVAHTRVGVALCIAALTEATLSLRAARAELEEETCRCQYVR